MQIFQIGGGDYQNLCGHLEGKKKLTLKDIFFMEVQHIKCLK